MYGCESWTRKKVECRRTDVFELWSLRRLLRVLWTSRRSNPINPKGNQSWIYIGRTDAEAVAPILWPPYVKSRLMEKTLVMRKIEGRRRRGWERMRWLDDITDSRDMSLSTFRRWWRTGKPGVLQSMGSPRVRHDWATEQQHGSFTPSVFFFF